MSNIFDHVFAKKSITFDCYNFLTRKQIKEELVTKVKAYGCFRELFLDCDLGSNEELIIRDVFIGNMQD